MHTSEVISCDLNFRVRKPLTPAEKQRRYRQRRDSDPQKRREYLHKQNEVWQERRRTGQVKSVANMTKTQHRAMKRYWRLTKERSRKQRKVKQEREEQVADSDSETESETEYSSTSTHCDEDEPSIKQE